MRIVKKDEFSGEMLGVGEVLAVPTETVFGLAVRMNDVKAVEKLMKMKERGLGSGKVLTMLLASPSEIGEYAEIGPAARKIIEENLPGELTIVLPKKDGFYNEYFDNFEEIGFRVPRDEFLNEIARDNPMLLTSANRRGEEPAGDMEEIKRVLPEVDLAIDGLAGGGVPTTVVRVRGDEIEVLRQGRIAVRQEAK